MSSIDIDFLLHSFILLDLIKDLSYRMIMSTMKLLVLPLNYILVGFSKTLFLLSVPLSISDLTTFKYMYLSQ